MGTKKSSTQNSLGTNYYVTKTGSDSNAGTQTSPFLTIQKAINVAVAGDTVYIYSGVYFEKVTMQSSGSLGKPITLKNYQGESPIIDGTGIVSGTNGWGGLVDTNEKDYLVFDGLTVQNVNAQYMLTPASIDHTKNGFGIGQAWHVTIVGSKHIIVRNCNIRNTACSGINFRNGTDITIDKCTVDNACFDSVGTDGTQECISLDNVDGFSITNCTVKNIVNAVDGLGGECIDAKNGSRNGTIAHNTIFDFKKIGIYVDAYSQHGYNIEIYDNKIYQTNCVLTGDSIGTGITLTAEIGGLAENIRVHHNVIYNTFYGLSLDKHGTAQILKDIYIFNNTIYNISEAGMRHFCDLISNVVIQSNIFHGLNDDRQGIYCVNANLTETHIAYNSFNDIYGNGTSNPMGTNYAVSKVPNFVDPITTRDFNLLTGSPFINTGLTLDGVVCNIGAYDGVSPIATTGTTLYATTGTITTVMDKDVLLLTPTGACTLNAKRGVLGKKCTLIVTTSGTTSYAIAFGTNFKTVGGSLSTGTTNGKVFCVSFIYNGSTWVETGRTVAM